MASLTQPIGAHPALLDMHARLFIAFCERTGIHEGRSARLPAPEPPRAEGRSDSRTAQTVATSRPFTTGTARTAQSGCTAEGR